MLKKTARLGVPFLFVDRENLFAFGLRGNVIQFLFDTRRFA